MDKKNIQLNDEQICALKIIDHVYSINKTGCQSIDISTPAEVLLFLSKNELIFRTSKGWFPSTYGQEYLANICS